jgi:3-dehydroquinate synthase
MNQNMKSKIINWPSGKTEIVFGGISELIEKFLSDRKLIFLCDENILRLYSELFNNHKLIKIKASEKAKSLKLIEEIYSKLLEWEADKNTILVAVGGGITCDIAGFVASTFYRGMPLVLVPTTLLSMVDAAIGGKNGVNFNEHKNLIGTIRQPEKILVDTNFLKTLPSAQMRNGMAEVIKHSFISDGFLYSELKKAGNIKNWQKNIMSDSLLWQIMNVKIDIVLADEQENEKRKILNFGHTLGHIIEMQEKLTHGEAVGIGMVMATKLSIHLNKCMPETENQLTEMLTSFGLPVSTTLSIVEINKHLKFDKKKSGNEMHFVFIEKMGHVYTEAIPIEKLKKLLLEVFG